MRIAELVDAIEADGPLIADAAERAGWSTAVPGLTWDVRQLVTHVGGVHRWATEIVATAAIDIDNSAGRAVGTGPADDELLGWFRSGHARLVATLREAPTDLTCATFLPAPTPLTFWARRQAHETAIHRADAESAAGGVTAFTPDFAQDGIDELLTGFAARKRKRDVKGKDGALALRADDGGSWTVQIGPETISAAESNEADGDLVVSGTSSDLYLWLWNRPSTAVLEGDESVGDLWRQAVQVRWR